MLIWTEAYRPFILGGDVNAPISTEVEVGESIDIGCGRQAYLIVAPDGQTYVAESVTGAIVGTTIDQVRKDVAAAGPKTVRKQIETAKERVKKTQSLSNEEFWNLFK